MLDKVSLKLLKALYRKDLSDEEVIKILKHVDCGRTNIRIAQLQSDKMVSVRRKGGVPDGEGGYIDGTVNRLYHLEPNGRAEVERIRKNRLLWLIGTGIALLAAIGAILSALSTWVC